MGSLWVALAVAFGWQVAVYWVHKKAIQSLFPASLVIWYLLLLLMGIWAAQHYPQFQKEWRRLRVSLGAGTLTAMLAFLPAALRLVDGGDVHPFHYVATYWAYTGLASLFLLGVCPGIVARWPRSSRGLALLGAYSMELYLLHPALLSLVTRSPYRGSVAGLALYLGAIFAGITAVSLGFAVLLRKLRLGGVLFGR